MVASQNGWRANDRNVVSTRNVPGTSVRLAVRNGSPGDLLLEVAARFHREVESIEATADDWGYAERNVRGSATDLSNHASGTAIDLNATRHPLGKAGTFSGPQTGAIRRIVDATGGVVRWGGDYGEPARGGVRGSRVDEMHFEINDGRTESQCTAALARLRGSGSVPAPAGGRPTLQKGATGALVGAVIRWANAAFPAYEVTPIPLLDPPLFGPGTEGFVREFQGRVGLVADGVIGPKTWAEFERNGFRG